MKNQHGNASLMGGSGGRVIPKINSDFNTPFQTPDEKYGRRVHATDKAKDIEMGKKIFPQPEPPQPMLQMTVMDNIKGDSKPKPPTYIYPSAMAQIPDPLMPTTTFGRPWGHEQYNVPIVNKYNIVVQGLAGDMLKAANIFEDILPETNVAQNRMTTLGERLILHSYIRGILIKRGDGEEVTMNGSKSELLNLLSYMKIMELNPYHYSRLTSNHYATLADNFVMFRSCYPIRKSTTMNNITCASDNVGANVRVYSMSVYDELANLLNDNGIEKVFSDAWREIMFYTFIREEILKKKVCPHFPFLHAYYITDNNSVDFDKLKGIKKSVDFGKQDQTYINNAIRSNLFTTNIDGAITSNGFGLTLNMANISGKTKGPVIKFNEKSKWQKSRLTGLNKLKTDTDEYVVTDRSTKCIVAVTEAPDQNIIDWSSRIYVIEDGPIKKQVSSGMHSDATWRSVLFQLYISFVTMWKHKILIKEFSWEKNIFIKTFSDSGAIGFWKYRVNNIDFFVPNMKAMVMIDSCFDQIKDGYQGSFKDNFRFKLLGKFFETPSQIKGDNGLVLSLESQEPTSKDFKELFLKMFDWNAMSQSFKDYGGVVPSSNIGKLVDSINKNADLIFPSAPPASAAVLMAPPAPLAAVPMAPPASPVINEDTCAMMNTMVENFGFFLHNKIGTMVDQTDMQQLFSPGINITECKKGDLIAIDTGVSEDMYEWAMFISRSKNMGMCKVLKQNLIEKRFVSENVSLSGIRRVYGPISQIYKSDSKISSSDELLETYSIVF